MQRPPTLEPDIPPVQRNLATADIVEINVALAEALVLEREGAALTSKRAGFGRSGTSTSLKVTSSSPSHEEKEGGTETDVEHIWDAEKAAVNQRRIALLSHCLEASSVHDLQMLRQTLERQVDDVTRTQGKAAFRPRDRIAERGGGVPRESTGVRQGIGSQQQNDCKDWEGSLALHDEDAQWHADVLDSRLAAVNKAVENKGGWRAAVFLDGGGVHVDVDVESWPAAEGVLMLQTVKDALVVQLIEVRCSSSGFEKN